MRKRLLVALAAVLAVAIAALGASVYLRSEAERNWRLALAQLERSLGPEAAVTYGALELELFALGGKVRELAITAPGLPEPFELAVAELAASGLAPEGAAELRFDSAEARALTVETPEGRWRIGHLQLRDLVFSGRPGASLPEQLERLSASAGEAEEIQFDQPTERVDPLVGRLARLEAGQITEGRVESLRFERLAVDQDRAQHLELARGGLDGLSLVQLAAVLAGEARPGRPLARHTRLEDFLLQDEEAEVRFASLEADERVTDSRLHQELTVEGLTFSSRAPALVDFWVPIQQAGFDPAFRLHGITILLPEEGHLTLERLLLEIPDAASLELTLEVLGMTEQPVIPDPEALEAEAAQLRLVSAGLTLVNSGGLDVILEGPAGAQGMTAQQLRQVAAFQVVEAVRQGALPREIGVALQEFLAEPGRLEVRLAPEQPAALLALALFAVAPQLAVEQLGISARSTPPE